MNRTFVATARPWAYLRRMPVIRVMRILTILAVLLAPLGMFGGTSAEAMAHRAPSATMHHAAPMTGIDCAGMTKSDRQPDRQAPRKHDCMMACAAIPASGSEIPAKMIGPRVPDSPLLSTTGLGLEPEAETPPPRSAPGY